MARARTPRNRRVAPAAPPRPRQPLGSRLRAAGAQTTDTIRRVALLLRRPAIVLAALAALGSAVFGVRRTLLTSPRFALRDVILSPTRHEGEAALRRRLDLRPGTNLFRIDLGEVARTLEADPWIASASARRQLPGTLVIDLVEREPRAAILLGSLYLLDATGVPFKRATTAEAVGLPILTGLSRDAYVADPASVERKALGALAVLDRYASVPGRPPLGEVHFFDDGRLALYTLGGTELVLGDGDGADLGPQLRRFDAVRGALGPDAPRARVVYLDNETRPDRVTIRFPNPPQAPVLTAAQSTRTN